MENYFSDVKLIETPSKRAAYSDRTAYMMAEMSRLAYFRFEGEHTIAYILSKLKEARRSFVPKPCAYYSKNKCRATATK